MELLSSKWTFLRKRIFLVVWCGWLLLFTVMLFPKHMWETDALYLVGPAVMLLFGVVLSRRFASNLVDEVRDGGGVLVVRKGNVEDRIPLTDIVNINFSEAGNPGRLSLRLRTPGKFGDVVDFLSRRRSSGFNPFGRNEVAEMLLQRIDAARQEGAP
jgi:hypothetical protein